MMIRVGTFWTLGCLLAWSLWLTPGISTASVILQPGLAVMLNVVAPAEADLRCSYSPFWRDQLQANAAAAWQDTKYSVAFPSPNENPSPTRRTGNSSTRPTAINDLNSFSGPVMVATIANGWQMPHPAPPDLLAIAGDLWPQQLFVTKILKIPICDYQ